MALREARPLDFGMDLRGKLASIGRVVQRSHDPVRGLSTDVE
jgi:hypothetical protein